MVQLRGQPAEALVTVNGDPVTFPLPKAWPTASASPLLRRAAKVWRGLRTLVWHERLGSDPAHIVHTTYRAVAPDRLSYRITNGSAAIMIGTRRWDRARAGRWQPSRQPPLRQPVPYWLGVADAHLLGSARQHGRPVWRISFFDPRTPAWFTVAIDKHTFRTHDLEMTTTAHFMHQSYGPFNLPIRLYKP